MHTHTSAARILYVYSHKFPNVPLNTYNAIYFLSIPLGLSVLHMHETMIKIVCWLSFVFKFYVVFHAHKMCVLAIRMEQWVPIMGFSTLILSATFVFLSLAKPARPFGCLCTAFCRLQISILLFYAYFVCWVSIGHGTRISANGSLFF